MSNIERRHIPTPSDNHIIRTRYDTSQARERVEGVLTTQIEVKWLSLNSRLTDLATHAFLDLKDEDFRIAYIKGFRPVHLNTLANLGQPQRFDGFDGILPDSIHLQIPDQPLPPESGAVSDMRISLGSLCQQVSSHIDTWQQRRPNAIKNSDSNSLAEMIKALQIVAEFSEKTPVIMHMRRSNEDPGRLNVTGLSLNNYDTPDIFE